MQARDPSTQLSPAMRSQARTWSHGRAARLKTARGQTVHPATRRETDCASGDNQGPFRAARCRRMHSLGRGLSPDAQFGPRGEPVPRDSSWSCARRMAGDACNRPAAMRREGDPSTTLAFARSARDDTWPCRCAPYRVTHDRIFAESADPVTERYFDSWQTGCLARGSRGTVFRLVAGRECHKSKYRSFSLRW